MTLCNNHLRQFIDDNIKLSPTKLRLKFANKSNPFFDYSFAIDQIECRQKAGAKIPSFISNPDFIFPTTLSSEQCTNEIIAGFHADLCSSNDVVLDMTCGLGIDSMSIAKKCKEITSIDINPIVVTTAKHNASVLNIQNINFVEADSIQFLNVSNRKWDIIFIDPARRDSGNNRTYAFSDCSPDILNNFDSIKKHCNRLLIKASPMLDLTQSLRELQYITDIWIISLKNECKELLFMADFQSDTSRNDIKLHTLNFSNSELEDFSLELCNNNLSDGIINYIDDISQVKTGQFMYEPNASIMKAACWAIVSKNFPLLKKLAPNTHIFVSDYYYDNFPGRKLKIEDVIPPKSKLLKNFEKSQANVVVRNFYISAEQLKKSLKIKDGGDKFIYGVKTTALEKPLLIVSQKL